MNFAGNGQVYFPSMHDFLCVDTLTIGSKHDYEHDTGVLTDEYLGHGWQDGSTDNTRWDLGAGTDDYQDDDYLNSIFDTFVSCTANVSNLVREQLGGLCYETQMDEAQITRRVTFSSEIQVIVSHGHECRQFWIDNLEPHDVLRECWTLEGNDSSLSYTNAILEDLSRNSDMYMAEVEQHGRGDCPTSSNGDQSCQLFEGRGIDNDQKCWNDVLRAFQPATELGQWKLGI